MGFTSTEPPYFHILVGSEEGCDQYACRLNYETQGRLVVRLVRGSKMVQVDDLFNEFAAAFQFPLYFGENWPAFSECLRDLAWLPGQGYLAMISDAADLLRNDDPRDRATFVRILHDVRVYWGTTARRPQAHEVSLLPFHVLFHATEPRVDIVRKLVSTQYPDIPTMLIRDLAGGRGAQFPNRN